MISLNDQNTSHQCIFSALSRYLNAIHGVDMPPNQQWHCNVAITVAVICQFCSTYFIVVMTFERFYSIIKPHKAASFNTVKRAKVVIVCIVILGSVYNIPNLFYTLSTGRACFLAGKYQTTIFRYVYFWMRSTISFIVPFFSLLIMNSFIIHTLRHRSMTFKTKGEAQSQGQHSRSINYDKQVYITLLLVTFTFLVLFSPVYILSVFTNTMRYSPKTAYSIAATFLLLQVAGKMYYTIYGINFFLYVISGPKFRTDLVALFQITKNTKTVDPSRQQCSTQRTLDFRCSSFSGSQKSSEVK